MVGTIQNYLFNGTTISGCNDAEFSSKYSLVPRSVQQSRSAEPSAAQSASRAILLGRSLDPFGKPFVGTLGEHWGLHRSTGVHCGFTLGTLWVHWGYTVGTLGLN